MANPETIQRIRVRLAVVKHLIETTHPLAVPDKTGPTTGPDGAHDGGWVYTHEQLDGLAAYLLLTCFVTRARTALG